MRGRSSRTSRGMTASTPPVAGCFSYSTKTDDFAGHPILARSRTPAHSPRCSWCCKPVGPEAVLKHDAGNAPHKFHPKCWEAHRRWLQALDGEKEKK